MSSNTLLEKKLQLCDEFIKKTERLNELAKELKESLIYESCKYHLVNTDTHNKLFMLMEIESKVQLISGNMNRIDNYISSRQIDRGIVYGL
jgi:phosphate uptake regulator